MTEDQRSRPPTKPMSPPWRQRIRALLGATFVIALQAQPALAQATPPSLAGPPVAEQFAATTTPFPPGFGGYVTVDSKSCNADGSGSATFTADGTATGAYPGHFHETGTMDIAASAYASGPSPVTRADAHFQITADNGDTVDGFKHLDRSVPPYSNAAGYCGFGPAWEGNFLSFNVTQPQTYQATITTPQGQQYGDSGITGTTFQTEFQGTDLIPLNTFVEAFQTSNGVSAIGHPAPTISCPGPMSVEADQAGGATVTPGSATATGDGVTIAGPKAGFYPLGTTTVTYTATDSSGAKATCAMTITVVDTTPPSLTCPANITLPAGPGGTATAIYTATASDIAGPATVDYSRLSGSTFTVGTSTVTVTAKDPSGNASVCTFTVTVKPTVQSVCSQTLGDVQGSNAYAAAPGWLRSAINSNVATVCKQVAALTASLTPTQKTQMIAAFKRATTQLVAAGLLTGAQASDLAAQTDQL